MLLRWPWRWNLLVDALVWPVQIEVSDIFLQNTLERALAKHQEMVEAFTSDTAQKALINRIGFGGMKWRFPDFDASASGHTGKL